MADRTVEIHTAFPDGSNVVVGRLHLYRGRQESATFQYDASWLGSAGAYAIDPQLQLATGAFHSRPGQSLFGALADSAPDRWGVELARRFERRRAEAASTTARTLAKADFFLAVTDELRQGALRVFDPARDEYLAAATGGVPLLVELSRLLSASARLERDADTDDDLRLLLAAGSSLGGARPKASVVDRNRLYIAKFPRVVHDAWSVVAWEYVAHQLATDAGISVPSARLETVDGQRVLLVERFDRVESRRIGFISAMTLLEARDHDTRTYVEIAEAIEEASSRTTADLAELWRRIAFSILVSNTDDHLRNHGFLRREGGWALAPAYDINPNPDAPGTLSTALEDPLDRRADIERLAALAPLFRIDDPRTPLARMLDATARWQTVARSAGVGDEIERVRPAFEHEQRAAAQRLVRG